MREREKLWKMRRASEGQVKGGREGDRGREQEEDEWTETGCESESGGGFKSVITARRHTASPFNNLIME